MSYSFKSTSVLDITMNLISFIVFQGDTYATGRLKVSDFPIKDVESLKSILSRSNDEL